jgi:Flp pilus assembly protein TadG
LFTLKREEGQALVETALSMSLLLLMMLGAVEFGAMAFSAIAVSNAARAAAQYGSQTAGTASDVPGMQQKAQNEYPTPSALSLASATSCSCAGTGTSVVCTKNGLGTAAACPGSYMEVTLTVQAQVSYTPLIHIPGLPGPFQLRGIAKQKVLQ